MISYITYMYLHQFTCVNFLPK